MTSGSFVLLTILAVAIVSFDRHVTAKGAGRAFPIASENFAIDSFQRTNPSLEWDPTNFLVDLSGHYAHCKAIHSPPGVVRITRLTPRGETVVGVVDYTEGSGSDTESVNGYIQTIIRRWQSSNIYYNQVKAASVVGCSVRPSCGNLAVVACLFSPGYGVIAPQTTRPPVRPTFRPTVRTTEWVPVLHPTELVPERYTQRALAFTPEQYSEAESVLGRKWDRSHYLENLSGYETDCSMIGTTEWSFPHVKKLTPPDIRIIGQYGVALNRGTTPDALREIIAKFKPVSNSREIGCSIIPDCVRDSQMYVVVSCLFEEYTSRRFR